MTAGDSHSVCTGSILFLDSILSIPDLLKSRAFDPAQYGTRFIDCIVRDSRSTRCFTVEIRPRCLPHPELYNMNISIISCLYFKYSLEMTVVSRQSDCSSFWNVDGEDYFLGSTVTTRLRRDWSYGDDFCGALALTKVDISSFRCPGTLCFSNFCRCVVVLVVRIKNVRLCKASTAHFAGFYRGRD